VDRLDLERFRRIEKVDHGKKDRDDPEERLRLEQLREDGVEGSAKDELLEQPDRDRRSQRAEEHPHERLRRVDGFIPAESDIEGAEEQQGAAGEDKADEEMLPPDRIRFEEELLAHGLPGGSGQGLFFSARIEPAQRRPEHQQSAQENGTVEVTREMGATHRIVDALQPGPLEPALGDDMLAAKEKERSKNRPEDDGAEEKDRDFKKGGLEKGSSGHTCPIRRNDAFCNGAKMRANFGRAKYPRKEECLEGGYQRFDEALPLNSLPLSAAHSSNRQWRNLQLVCF